MLLKRLFCPPSVVPGTPAETTCGTVTMKSVKLRLKVGRRWMSESETILCVPVRERETRRLASPVTVTASSPTAVRLKDTLIFYLWPSLKLNWFLFFFFQAEDGIRDGRVTGVQTCALPISSESAQHQADWFGHEVNDEW